MVGSLAWSELKKNLPYLLIVGSIIGFIIRKMIQSVKKKIMGSRKTAKYKLGDEWTR